MLLVCMHAAFVGMCTLVGARAHTHTHAENSVSAISTLPIIIMYKLYSADLELISRQGNVLDNLLRNR